MYLSGSILGLSAFLNKTAQPIEYQYNKMIVYGNAIIDKVKLTSTESTNEYLQAIDVTETLQWTPETLLMAEFENILSAGNVVDIVETVTSWQIGRKDSEETVMKDLGTVNVSVTEFVDYTAQANRDYVYDVFALTENQISEPLETEEITADFYGWYLVGQDSDGSDYVYEMDLDEKFNGYKHEEDFSEYQTYTKYNAFAKGDRDFLRGSIGLLAGSIQSDGSLLQTVDYIDGFRARLTDGLTKTLKSKKGEIYKVKTHGVTINPINDDIISQPYLVKFNFVECEQV